jgi:hypothetical protein
MRAVSIENLQIGKHVYFVDPSGHNAGDTKVGRKKVLLTKDSLGGGGGKLQWRSKPARVNTSKSVTISRTGKVLNKVLDTKVGNKLFGKKGVLNNNDKVRIGTGFKSRPQGGVDKVFRIGVGKGKGANQSKKMIEILLKEFPKK